MVEVLIGTMALQNQQYGIKEPDLKDIQYILNIAESNLETIF
jgi:hypothetical protein